jgi:DNA invertase Pin-like site-specific DNA recombinase
MKIGYARVSTNDQNLDLQTNALEKDGCSKIFSDKATGKNTQRAGLQEALEYLRKGDVLVIWKLDRLGRSLKDLIQIVTDLEKKEIGFRSLTESMDTTSPSGKLVFHIFASLAEFERNVNLERTKAGLSAARARGKFGGRKKKLTVTQIAAVKTLYHSKETPIGSICNDYNIARSTLYKYINS